MYDFCPLCLKSGARKSIKLLQINLKEAVWVCEDEKCLWPFGYEDLVFQSRPVGKSRSCNWDDYQPRFKESITSTKPSLCNAHIMSVENISEGFIARSNLQQNVTDISNDTNVTHLKSVPNFISENEIIIPCNNPAKQRDETNVIANKESTINNIDLITNHLELIDTTENIEIKTEHTNSSNTCSKENKIPIKNMKNRKVTPKITSIEKTNIDISSVKIKSKISVYQNLNKKTSSIKKPVDITETKLELKDKKFPYLESTKNNKSVPKSNLKEMKIANLPRVTVSFNITGCNTIPQTVQSKTPQNDNTKLTSSEPSFINSKPNRMIAKTYEKFSFRDIKNKKESSNSVNTNSKNNSLKKQTDPKPQELKHDFMNDTKIKECSEIDKSSNITSTNYNGQAISNSNITCTSNQFCNSRNNSTNGEILPDMKTIDTNTDVDTILNDLLSKDYTVPEDTKDESLRQWMNDSLDTFFID